jgi:polysaccharide chain length determinant protein (PEP-CTERM system associated)
MVEGVPKSSPLDTLSAIWSRRKWLALVAFAAPMAVGLSLIAFVPNVYRSAATVLVDRQQVPESFVRSTVTSALEIRLHTISQEVLSRARLETLISRFDLYADLRKEASPEVVIERMRKDIKLELKSAELRGLREATVAFTISYQGHDPERVALVTNTLASFYIEENLKARERQATGTAEFLKVQLTETKRRLDEQEQRVSGFKRRHLGELPQQMETNLGTLDRLHMQLRQNADGQTRAGERRQAISSQLAELETLASSQAYQPFGPAVPGLALPMPELREPAVRLAQKKEELARLRSQFSERYPDVAQVAAEVAVLEREVAAAEARLKIPPEPETTASASPAPARPTATSMTPYVLRLKESLSEAQTDLKVLKTEEAHLRSEIAAYQARVENVPRREQEFKELSRDYESTRELYNSLLKRYEEAQLAESMEQRQKGEQFRVLDAAVANAIPAAPNRLRLFLLTLTSAIALAVGLVLAVERHDTSFHDIDELRAFSTVPVLSSIPKIVTRTDLRRNWWRMRLGGAAVLGGLVLIVGITYVAASWNDRLVSLLAR